MCVIQHMCVIQPTFPLLLLLTLIYKAFLQIFLSFFIIFYITLSQRSQNVVLVLQQHPQHQCWCG